MNAQISIAESNQTVRSLFPAESPHRRILIVDDNQGIRSLLQDCLEEEGYEVETANDGWAAWSKVLLQPGTYQVIVFDGKMPEMNGLQLLQELQQAQGPIPAPVMISGDIAILAQAAQMGLCSLLRKPFDLETFLELLSTVEQEPEAAFDLNQCEFRWGS